MQLQRPLSVREVFQAGLMVYRRRIRTLMGTSLLVLFPYLLASTYVRTHFTTVTSQEMQDLMTKAQGATNMSALLHAFPLGLEVWFVVLALVYFFMVVPLLFGIVVHLTAQKVGRNKDLTLAEAGNASFHRLWPNVMTLLVAALMGVIGATLYTFVLSILASLISAVAPPLAGFLAVIGGLALVVGVIWFVVKMAFLPAIVMEEQTSAIAAIRRSFRLTRGQTRRLVGFFLVLFVVWIISQTFMTLIGDVIFQSPGGQLLVSAIVGMLVTPFMFVCISIMYLDLRARKID